MDLDTVADELFGLPLGEFTPTRNKRSKRARADGDRELARQIQALRKPTTSAWLVNQLARHHGDELEPLLELGRDLREAGAALSGDDLRAMTRQRHQVVHALVQVARRLGRDQGLKVSDAVADEVRETLEASLADPDASDAVLVGRLTRHLQQVGFGVIGIEEAQTRSAPPSRPKAKVTELDSRRRERAERKAHQAARALEQAESSLRQARQEHETASMSQQSADAEVERLRAELDRAEQLASSAADDERAKHERFQRAEQRVRDAEQAHQQAQEGLGHLTD